MAQSDIEPAPTPAFPTWPFDCMAMYSHLARDWSRYAQAAAKATDPMQAFRAENDYGLRLYHDLIQGWYDLALAPWKAALKEAEELSHKRAA